MFKALPMRWLALIVLMLGDLMIVLDSTIVNIALPSIRTDLGFTETGLVWVVNAYLLTFGGFLLLGGRLGDLYGPRKLFLIGITLFTFASLACGVAGTQTTLIMARAIQGVGGAVVSAVGLSLLMKLFTDPAERVRAMALFGFVMAGGGSVGVLLGGVLVGALDWHWIFFINIPIGLLVLFLSMKLLPHSPLEDHPKHLDVAGAITITSALMLAVYAIVGGNAAGWLSKETLGFLAGAAALLVAFVFIEKRVRAPLVPFSLFKLKNVLAANIISVLWAASMFAWFFISALYLQVVVQYTPMQVGLAFLPANLLMAVFSISLSAKMVMKFGIKIPMVLGLAIAAFGLAWFGFAPVDGSFVWHVLPAMLLLGLGGGMAFNPVLLAAMSDVPQNESGLASGVVNTAFMMGGAVGLAVLASLAAARTTELLASGATTPVALNGGYHVAFFTGAIFAGLAAIIGAFFIRKSSNTPSGHGAH